MATANSKEISQVKEQNKFITRVYAWMTAALSISGIFAYFTSQYLEAMGNQALPFFKVVFPVLAIAEIVMVFALSASIKKISSFAAGVMFVIYSVMNGITLSSIFIVYELSSLVSVFAVSALMFAAMVLYGTFTKQNILSYGRYFSMALIGVLIATGVNFLFRALGWETGAFDTVISIVCVVLFTGLSAYDAQKMIRAAEHANDSEVFKKASIIGALELYLDFINIFLAMLRLFGRRK